ncbi:hypothetical protein llap_15776 [Limosa lapponica baueri]|uniref:ZZ-type domain-containing protein n=1 Tax=Limosa lapponica baueri TaxID=1758121 RepID=A0A2I0TJC2_LIMLA|nr:hypothetical protein llap_15776 [Limosa lapponica baueri]
MALATLCGGKIMDKLRCIVGKDSISQKKVTLNTFLDTLMSDPPPQCLVWLPLLHRLANVENVFHPVECSYCHSESMMGFRYRCQQCHNYQLCQDCFWRGHASGSHSNQHQMKEYTSWGLQRPQEVGEELHNSRKTGQGAGAEEGNTSREKEYSSLVPGPQLRKEEVSHWVYLYGQAYTDPFALLLKTATEKADLNPTEANEDFPFTCVLDSASRLDEEHKLIARYAARLAAETSSSIEGDDKLKPH